MKTNSEIDIRDTYILPYKGKYYMYGTSGFDAFTGTKSGFVCYVGDDLLHWDGPFCVFPNDGTSWATQNYWAPEVYEIAGTFYLFASWSRPRQTQTLCVLKADSPLGPFEILNDRLGIGNDPTLYQGEDGYYLIHNDVACTMLATKLNSELSAFCEASVPLFTRTDKGITWSKGGPCEGAETYVTPTGKLLILWSSFCEGNSQKFEQMGFHNMDYGTAISYASDGNIFGPYTHEDVMLTPPNMGHCNLFYALDGRLMLSTHYPDDNENAFGCSNPVFFPVQYCAEADTLRIDPREFEKLK